MENIAWYWTLGGLIAFGGTIYGAAYYIRAEGKGKLAEWLREKWPDKDALS